MIEFICWTWNHWWYYRVKKAFLSRFYIFKFLIGIYFAFILGLLLIMYIFIFFFICINYLLFLCIKRTFMMIRWIFMACKCTFILITYLRLILFILMMLSYIRIYLEQIFLNIILHLFWIYEIFGGYIWSWRQW